MHNPPLFFAGSSQFEYIWITKNEIRSKAILLLRLLVKNKLYAANPLIAIYLEQRKHHASET